MKHRKPKVLTNPNTNEDERAARKRARGDAEDAFVIREPNLKELILTGWQTIIRALFY